MQSTEKLHRCERTVKNATTYPHTTKHSPFKTLLWGRFVFRLTRYYSDIQGQLFKKLFTLAWFCAKIKKNV